MQNQYNFLCDDGNDMITLRVPEVLQAADKTDKKWQLTKTQFVIAQ